MLEPFLGSRLEFDIQHDLSYDMPGYTVGEQCLPRLIGVHLIFVGLWSKGWGQHQSTLPLLNAIVSRNAEEAT
jgi:hypothetical protein